MAGSLLPFFYGPTGRNIHVDSSGRLITTGETGQDLFPFGFGQFGRVCVVDASGRLVISPLSPGLGVGGSGESNTGENLGAGVGVFAQKMGVVLQFKSLVEGSGIQITSDSDEITINAPDMGNINTASNVGTSGFGIFKQKSGSDLQFKKLVPGLGLEGISSADSMRIAGSGVLFRPFRQLASATGITVDLSKTNNFYINLANNATLTLNSPKDGGRYMFITRQSVGSNTITFPSSVKWKGGTDATLTAASGSIDVVTLAYLAALDIYVGDFGNNFF